MIERGTDLTINVVFLGRWATGTSRHIDEYGYITSTDSTAAHPRLNDTQLYTLPTSYNLLDYLPAEPAAEDPTTLASEVDALAYLVSCGLSGERGCDPWVCGDARELTCPFSGTRMWRRQFRRGVQFAWLSRGRLSPSYPGAWQEQAR